MYISVHGRIICYYYCVNNSFHNDIMCDAERGRRHSILTRRTSATHPSARQAAQFGQIASIVQAGALCEPMGRSLRKWSM